MLDGWTHLELEEQLASQWMSKELEWVEVSCIDDFLPHAVSHSHGIDGALCGIAVDVDDVGLGDERLQVAVAVGVVEQTRGTLGNVGDRQHLALGIVAVAVPDSRYRCHQAYFGVSVKF